MEIKTDLVTVPPVAPYPQNFCYYC